MLFAEATPPALHVVVDEAQHGAWYTADWIWVAAGSLISAAVALATFRLARFTKSLAEKTAELSLETRQSVLAAQDAVAAEERRHRDSLQPHVAIALSMIRDEQTCKQYPGKSIITVTNIGPGFASTMRFDILYDADDYEFNRVRYAPPGALGTNQSHEVLVGFDSKKLKQFITAYDDAFGNGYESRLDPDYMVGKPYSFRRLPPGAVWTPVELAEEQTGTDQPAP
jgi:hypothetical protein